MPIGMSVTRAEAARIMNVSPRSVARAAQVLDHGSPELIASVEQGKVSVSAAARIVRPSSPPRAKPLNADEAIGQALTFYEGTDLAEVGRRRPSATPTQPCAGSGRCSGPSPF
jgi:hypothetical protein